MSIDFERFQAGFRRIHAGPLNEIVNLGQEVTCRDYVPELNMQLFQLA